MRRALTVAPPVPQGLFAMIYLARAVLGRKHATAVCVGVPFAKIHSKESLCWAANAQTTPVRQTDSPLVLLGSEPLESQPLESQPLESQPLESQPLELQPLESQPLELQPLELQLLESQLLESQPLELQLLESQLLESQPLELQLLESQPLELQLLEAETRPLEAQPGLAALTKVVRTGRHSRRATMTWVHSLEWGPRASRMGIDVIHATVFWITWSSIPKTAIAYS